MSRKYGTRESTINTVNRRNEVLVTENASLVKDKAELNNRNKDLVTSAAASSAAVVAKNAELAEIKD